MLEVWPLLKNFLSLIVAGLALIALAVANKVDAAKLPGLGEVLKLKLDKLPGWVGRLVVVLVGLGLILAGFGRDVSTLFPRHLRMDVYFDLPGLRSEVASVFDKQELQELGVRQGWESRTLLYDQALKEHLATLWELQEAGSGVDTAYVARETLHAHGKTSFIVERVGLLSYRLIESVGELKHRIDVPRIVSPLRQFKTEFELRPSAGDHLRPRSILRFLKKGYTLQPRFKQILTKGRDLVEFDHEVIGATKVHVFPMPKFGNTIYLWRDPDGGLVPVAYAVYYSRER